MTEPTELIEKYADKFVATVSEVAPEAWEILIRGQVVEGITLCVVATAWFLAAASATAALKFAPTFKSSDERAGGYAGGAALTVFCFAVGMAFASRAIPHLAAPEYMALKELMR